MSNQTNVINDNFFHNIAKQYNLGEVIELIVQLTDSDINKTFKIQTEKSAFIIKLIHIENYKKYYQTSEDALFSSLNFSEKVADLMKNNHIDAVTSLHYLNKKISSNDNFLILVYPFIEGEICSFNEVTNEKIKQIAYMLAIIHQIKPDNELSQLAMASWNEAIALVKNIIPKKIWLEFKEVDIIKMKKLYDFFDEVTTDIILSTDHIHQLVLTHNDLKPKNILWLSSGKPAFIDWETAGLMPISVDYMDTLLGWCVEYKNNELVLNIDKCRLFKTNYELHSSPVKLEKDTSKFVIVKWLLWLSLCINQFQQSLEPQKYIALIHEALSFLDILRMHRLILEDTIFN